MHRALFVLDILVEIFVHLRFSSRSLAALARTRKMFYEPAMNLLWANMPNYAGIIPLLGCVTRLHPMIYDSDKIWWVDFNHSQGIEPLSAHEVHQFLRHASRVRSLNVSTEHLHLLAVLPIETCVFPRLSKLSLSCEQRMDVECWNLFLSPTLRHCTLPPFHPSIGTRCAVLEDLCLSALNMTTAEDLDLLSDTVRSCKRLVKLRCPPLDSAAWKHLSNLHTLLTVKIRKAYYGTYHPLDRNNLEFAPFLNVRTICFSFDLGIAEGIITLLQRSKFPSLKNFGFNVTDGSLSSGEVEQLFRALSQCNTCRTLQHVVIYLPRPDVQEHSILIRQLFPFAQLQTISLTFCNPIYLDNDFILEAMSSWPHIRSLRLENRVHCRQPGIIFRGLFAALRLCPTCTHSIYRSML
ncbi:hypothetical protein K503DRAFT_518147 [Rhizopogon vinicolor AM-OR11-026]|uniref:F-box domain-containing protein n=1 Tax=Rhizopogon vinicolor AM-OR11-026 TaxID=1314800 RepID=A0A1B7MLQ5_9AGAM|nr:hypothetical protein K503DRAFT_518147 [Rhizopogon vinicolor AM-OR11-026]